MLLPYASDRPPRSAPIVVVTLVLVNFALFGLVALVLKLRGASAPVVWYANLSLVPASLHWYSFVTYAFLHEDVFHLSGNMLFLWVFGGSVEDVLKWKRFLAVYLSAVVLTGLLQAGMAFVVPGADPTMPILGASGAVSAVIGVFAVRFYRSRIRFIGVPFRVPAIVLLACVLLIEMAAALWQLIDHASGRGGAGVAHWAHIGGFLMGMAFAQATRLFTQGRHEYLATDAAVEMQRGAPLAAAQRWEAVLQAQPEDWGAEAELGRVWATVGDREQSLPHYRRAVAGMLKQGDKAAATARYREMTRFFPNVTFAAPEQFAVAGALEEQGAFAEAIAAFAAVRRADRKSPEAEMALLRMGVLYLNRLGSAPDARRELAAFVEAYPRSEWRTYAEDLLRTAQARTDAESRK